MKKIIYKPIQDFPGYRVGNDGSVWSCRKRKRIKGVQGGTYVILIKKWKKLNPTKNRQGRMVVGLFPGGTQKLVHRLVLEAFTGKKPLTMQVRHFPDPNPQNNKLSNLCWGSPNENHLDAVKHGTKGSGKHSSNRKLTISDVREIRRCYKRYSRGSTNNTISLGKQFGVRPTTIWNIIHHYSWPHITE